MKKIRAEEYTDWDKTILTEEKGALLDIDPPEMTPLMSLEILKFVSYGRFEFDFDTIEKSLKVLEIIRIKKVNVEWLLESENVEEYNESLYADLTREEFALLKEVLL